MDEKGGGGGKKLIESIGNHEIFIFGYGHSTLFFVVCRLEFFMTSVELTDNNKNSDNYIFIMFKGASFVRWLSN